jgi:hypothetical protein
LLYATFELIVFELFARAKSTSYFDRIKSLLSVTDKADLVKRIEAIEADPERIPKWQWESIHPRGMILLDAIATSP